MKPKADLTKRRRRRPLHEVLAGVELIKAERLRQISKEGWTLKHDDTHSRGEMADAASAYLGAYLCYPSDQQPKDPPGTWPWSKMWWKPSNDPIRMLVKAGALIAAEIDRLERLKAKPANAKLTHGANNQ